MRNYKLRYIFGFAHGNGNGEIDEATSLREYAVGNPKRHAMAGINEYRRRNGRGKCLLGQQVFLHANGQRSVRLAVDALFREERRRRNLDTE